MRNGSERHFLRSSNTFQNNILVPKPGISRLKDCERCKIGATVEPVVNSGDGRALRADETETKDDPHLHNETFDSYGRGGEEGWTRL